MRGRTEQIGNGVTVSEPRSHGGLRASFPRSGQFSPQGTSSMQKYYVVVLVFGEYLVLSCSMNCYFLFIAC